MQEVDKLILQRAEALNIDGFVRVRGDHSHGAKCRLTRQLGVQLLSKDGEHLVNLLLTEDTVCNSHNLGHGNNAALLDLLGNILLLQNREDFRVKHDGMVLELLIEAIEVCQLSDEVTGDTERVRNNLALTLEADDGAEELGDFSGMFLRGSRSLGRIISRLESSMKNLQRVRDEVIVVLDSALFDVRNESRVVLLELVEHDHREDGQRLHNGDAHLDIIFR